MKHKTVATLFALVFSMAALAQSEPAQPVEVTNWPAVQTVTGDELRDSREALLLLVMQLSGSLPPRAAPPMFQECSISGLEDFREDEVVRVAPGKAGCNLETYAETCEVAARRHRERCSEVCGEFSVVGRERPCRGHDRPMIEVFSRSRHCHTHRDGGPTMSCGVTGWCSCNP